MTSMKNMRHVSVIQMSKTLPVGKTVDADITLGESDYRNMSKEDVSAMLDRAGQAVVAHLTVAIAPEWWSDYVRLQKLVSLLTEKVGPVDLYLAFGAGGEDHIYRVALPSHRGQNSVMMSFDSLLAAFVERIDFKAEAEELGTLDEHLAEDAKWAEIPNGQSGAQTTIDRPIQELSFPVISGEQTNG
jgi:hypothetical protein